MGIVKSGIGLGLASCAALSAHPCAAAETDSAPIFLHLGISDLMNQPDVAVRTPAGQVRDAKIRLPPVLIPSIEAGYRLDDHWSASTTVGDPPTVDIKGRNALAGLGRIGSTTLAPFTGGIQYRVTAFGPLQPYVGGGLAYMLVLRDRDGSLSDLRVRSAWGGFVQGGAELFLTERIGLFADVKRAFIDTTFSARRGPVPIRAKASLNPLMLSGGIAYRF